MISAAGVRTLTIEASSHCNLHCPQCARFDQQGFVTADLAPGHLDIDRVIPALRLQDLKALESVHLEGDHGDVLMHPHIRQLIHSIPDHVQVKITTNGSLRSPDWWRELAARSHLTVVFSIDGLEDTNAIYRINSDWRRIMDNARSFIAAGGDARWKFIVFAHNQHQIDQARSLSQDMGFREFTTQHTNRSWWQGQSWQVKVKGQYLYDIQPSSQIDQINPVSHKVALHKIKNIQHRDPTPNCWLTRGDIYVNFQGYVLPCCMHSATTWQKDLGASMWRRLVGDLDAINLYHHDLMAILHSEFYQRALPASLQGAPFTHSTCVANCG